MSAVILGMLFGGALYLVGATQSKNIKGMLGLKNIVLMKIIAFGIGFGSFLVSIAYFLGIFDLSHLDIKPLHFGVVLGGLLGALVYSLSYEFWSESGIFEIWNVGKMTLFSLRDSNPALFSLGFEGLMMLGVAMMGIAYFLPCKEE